MPKSPEQETAYAALDAAIEQVIAATAAFREGQIITGYTVVVCGTRYEAPDLDESYEDGEDMVSSFRLFTKRSQQPALTRGILEYGLDHMRES